MQENSDNTPYVRRPGEGAESGTGPVYREVKMPNSLAKAASIIGVIAVISIFTMLIYPGIVLGSTAMILAFLSRDRDGHMHDKARGAVTSGAIAVVADLAIVALVIGILFSDGPFKQQLNAMFVETYGQTFDDMWNDARDGKLDLDYKFSSFKNSELQDGQDMSYNIDGSTV